MSELKERRELLSAALSAHVSELRLFWRETGMTCRWLVPDSEHCFVDDEILSYLAKFREEAPNKIQNPEISRRWFELVSQVVDCDDAGAVPFVLSELTWLLRVAESPHRDNLTEDERNLYLWNVRLKDLPSSVLKSVSKQLEDPLNKTILDFDTLMQRYELSRKDDFIVSTENEINEERSSFIHRFDRLRRFKNLIFYGIANIGKANLSKHLLQNWETMTGRPVGLHCVTVLNSGISYEDMIERRVDGAFIGKFEPENSGWIEHPRVLTDHISQSRYFFDTEKVQHVEEGLFLSLCRSAAHNPDKDYIFMIECIDEAKLKNVLGEASHMLDSFARVPWKMGKTDETKGWNLEAPGARSIRLNYSGRIFFVPANVYIIGTAIEHSLFTQAEDEILQSFAVEHYGVLNADQLLRAMLRDRSPVDFVRLEEYAQHSVQLWKDINDVLESICGHSGIIGYGPLFSMCEEILQSQDVQDAAQIVLGTWRYRMLPPLMRRMYLLLSSPGHVYREHLNRLVEIINNSWLRTTITIDGQAESECLKLSYANF